ncbi:hypothetical protein B0H19DRAFT_1109041 [Mycena capillaripes]|nr:hypothetical protein B0H19DRAFT_1192709 [Mycena capillaripes]KAJ6585274.1 hypothetical protein B0H19DRAFT_1109041 [Mycena capillaripes]
MHFPFSLAVFLYILGVLSILMLTRLTTASLSPLAQRRTSGVRQVHNNVFRSPYQSLREQRVNALRSPLYYCWINDKAGVFQRQRGRAQAASCVAGDSESRRRRRVPGQTENRAPSPTTGASQAQQMRLLGLATPPDSQPPVLAPCVALNTNKVEATFDLDARQYSQFANNYGNFLLSRTIMASGRWPTNKKPTPCPDKYVQVTRFLTGKDTKRFKMDVNNVTFLGNPSKSNAPKAPVPFTPVPSSSQARTIDHFAGTPSWMKKHKLDDGSDGPSSSQ